MALDGLAGALDARRFNHVRIERSLHQPIHAARFLGDAVGLIVKHGDELRANDFALLFGIGDTGELDKKRSLASTATMFRPSLSRRLSCTLWNSFLRRTPLFTKMQVNWLPMALCTSTAATEESTPPERPQMTWPSPTFSRMAATVLSMKWAGVQSPAAPQTLKTKFLMQLRAERRVMHFGMELHGPDAALFVGNRSQSVGGDGGAAKAGRQFESFVAVTHPDRKRGWQSLKQSCVSVFDDDFGVTVLALGGGTHLAAQVMHDELQTVADAEHGNAQFEHFGIGGRSIVIVDRRRSAGENHAQRLKRSNLRERRGAGQHNGKNILFADASRNQLRVLRTKIENYNRLRSHSSSVAGFRLGLQACGVTLRDSCPIRIEW